MQSNQSILVAGCAFGDEDKGSTVDFLARKGKVSSVVRYNGGAQAAHNVVTPDGRHHTFHQFGSGMFVPGMRTYLSRYMLLDPLALSREAMDLELLGCRRPLKRLSIDREALVVTPFHKSANCMREQLRNLRNGNMHGTCGMGIGETMAHSIAFPDEAIRAKDLQDPGTLDRKTRLLWGRLHEEYREYQKEFSAVEWSDVNLLKDSKFASDWVEGTTVFCGQLKLCSIDTLVQLAKEGNLIFEGSQGALLDEWYGFHPHTTWSTTTFSNALALLDEIGYSGNVEKLGVLRAYYTRHGTGPFVTEDPKLTQLIPERHNESYGWQGTFRCGWFDLVMARYALSVVGGVDSFAIGHLDQIPNLPNLKICTSYQFDERDLSSEEINVFEFVQKVGNGTMLSASSIKKKNVLTDLSYQERLTHVLGKVKPVYETIEGGEEEYLRFIEDALRTPISIVSHGPTAGDRKLRKLCL